MQGLCGTKPHSLSGVLGGLKKNYIHVIFLFAVSPLAKLRFRTSLYDRYSQRSFKRRGVLGEKMNTSDKAIGTITVLVKDRSESASKVNEIVSQFSNIIIGRLGLPYSDRDLSIITLVVDASTDEIGALTGKIGQISGISVKSSLIRA